MYHTNRTASLRRSQRLVVEVLEDRATPATFRWGLNGQTNNWVDSANWQVPAGGGGWAQAPAGNQAGINFPGVSDDVYFNNTSINNVTVDWVVLGKVTIESTSVELSPSVTVITRSKSSRWLTG